MRAAVGAVGGRVLGVDGRPEQDGLRLDDQAGVEVAGLRLPVIQRVSAVSSDCMAVERSTFVSVGGFDDRYRARMHDIDLCLRMRRAGLAIVFTPLTEVQRLGRSREVVPADDDIELFRRTWEGTAQWKDPYLSPWLKTVAPFVIRGV